MKSIIGHFLMKSLASLYRPGQLKEAAILAKVGFRLECPEGGVAWNSRSKAWRSSAKSVLLKTGHKGWDWGGYQRQQEMVLRILPRECICNLVISSSIHLPYIHRGCLQFGAQLLVEKCYGVTTLRKDNTNCNS